METTTQPVTIAGFAPQPTRGTMQLVAWSARERARRAWTGWAVCWALAAAAVFIPVAHLLLVPGLGVAGPVVFVRRWRRHGTVRGCTGRCPDCGTEQRFPVSGPPGAAMETRCASCHRGLTLRPVSDP